MTDISIKFSASGQEAVTGAFRDAEKSVKRLGDSVKNNLVFDEVNQRWRTSTGRFASHAEMASAGVENAFRGAKEKSGIHIDGLREMAVGAFRQIGAAAITLGAELGRAVVAFGKESITVAADYQSTLNNFSAVTGKAMETAGLSTQEFSQLFLDLGAKTQFSAGQAAQAAVELAKGGVAVADIYGGALDAALGLAAAGSLDLANAAEIMAKQLGVWGDTGVTATEITDLLAQAANASTVDVDNLAQGLAQVGGAAKIAGVEFPDLVQTMAMLAPGFASASDAGTSLKTFLQRMVPSTKEATKEMIALGLATENGSSKFFDSEGAFIGMGAAAELLKEATKDLSEEQRLAAFSTIFGSDALRAASMIAENGAAGFSEMGNAMTEAGTAAEQAALRNQGFNFAMESLKGSIETVQIVLGSAFLPTLTEVINNGLIPFVNNALAFVQAMLAAPDPIKFLSDALLNIIPPGVVELFDNLQLAIANLQLAWAENGGLIIADTQTFAAAVGTALGAIAAFVVEQVLPALVNIVSFVVANWPTIQLTIETVMTAIQGIIQSALTGIQAFWAEWGDEIMGIIQFYVAQFQNTLSMFTKAFAGDWRGFGEDLRQGWNMLWGALIQIILDGIDAFLKIDWASIGSSIIDGIARGVAAATKGLIDAVVAAARAAVEAVQGFLGIQSPSKVFAGIGANMMLGMGAGITSTAGVPAAAAAGAASYATQVSVGAVNVYSQPGQSETAIAQEVRRQLDEYARRGDTRARL